MIEDRVGAVLDYLDVPLVRPVRLKPISKSWDLWTVKILCFVACCLFSVFVIDRQGIPFWAGYFGLPTEATVIQKWVGNNYTAVKGVPTKLTFYHLVVQFEKGTATVVVSNSVYDGVKIGNQVPIHYFSWAANHPSIDIDKSAGFSLLYDFIFQLIFVPIGLIYFVYQWLTARKQKYLLMNGTAIRATVTGCSQGATFFYYEFELGKKIWKDNFVTSLFHNKFYNSGDEIDNNEPEGALDRLHTYTTKYLRSICNKHGIETNKDKPLHSLIGEYVKRLKSERLIESDMTEKILKSSISILDSFNVVRNDQSLAHDNQVLKYDESLLIFNNISSTIKFLKSLEEKIDKNKAIEEEPYSITSFDIPF